MKKAIIIVGMGPGLSRGVAEKFGQEGFCLGMISRNAEKLAATQQELTGQGIESFFATADVADTDQLRTALTELAGQLGRVDVLHYNAVDARMVNILDDTVDALTNGFRVSVGNALEAVRTLLPQLKQAQGVVLLTGGGTATQPNPEMASISLGKAGIRNLTYQLNSALEKDGVFVGTVTIGGWIQPESKTHAPAILAQKFWQLYQQRQPVELVY